MASRHVIKLEGPAARGAVISGEVLYELLGIMIRGSQKSIRLLVEGRSTASGTVPGWLRSSTTFDLLGFGEGSTDIITSARSLHETVPDHARLSLFGSSTEHADTTAIDVFTQGLHDAKLGRVDSDLFDAELLKTYAKFDRVLSYGFDFIAIGGHTPVCVDRSFVAAASQLRSSMPRSRQVRVTGKLEQIKHSDRRFTLLLEDGETVNGVADDGVPQELMAEAFGKQVVVTGLAVFRPSGTVLRVEARRFDEPDEGAHMWSSMPRPIFGSKAPYGRHRSQRSSWGSLDDIVGEWPGDEDDETIDRVLEIIS